MRYDSAAIVRKYAVAFVNIFLDVLTQNDHDNMLEAEQFLRSQQRILFFLQLPALDKKVKEHGLEILADRFLLPISVRKLLFLLLVHDRAFLIPDVLWYVTELYKERNDMLSITIRSSHELSSEDLLAIERFLVHLTGKVIIYTCAIDKKLIAGIRLQSTTVLWEYSVHKHLHNVELLS